jgi:hypothetical protein
MQDRPEITLAQKKLRASIIMLIKFSEELEERKFSQDSITKVQKNLEELLQALETAKKLSVNVLVGSWVCDLFLYPPALVL